MIYILLYFLPVLERADLFLAEGIGMSESWKAGKLERKSPVLRGELLTFPGVCQWGFLVAFEKLRRPEVNGFRPGRGGPRTSRRSGR